jgi:excisionase family DNA binding protein
MENDGRTIVEQEAELVSPRVAAPRLGVSRSLVYKLCKTGQIPHYRLGSALRVNLAEVRKGHAARERA